MPRTCEPKDNRSVWIASSAARIAHSTWGAMEASFWLTRCGCRIQVVTMDGRAHQYGSLIEWRLLNHDLVRPCRRCFG